jgi:elongation factor P
MSFSLPVKLKIYTFIPLLVPHNYRFGYLPLLYRVIDKTFTAGVKVNEVRIERRPFQFLYNDDMGYHFMNTETFEQVSIPAEQIEGVDFLKEGDIVEAQVHADTDTILTAEVPPHVVLEVTYTEPGLKGDTATNALKPATLETGAEIRVPLFIDTGDKVKVDTRTGNYVERVKE